MNIKIIAVSYIVAFITMLVGCVTPPVRTENNNFVTYRELSWMPIGTGRSNEKNWADANAYCTKTTINGLIGWRLPTHEELLSTRRNIFIFGTNTIWSSTPFGKSPGHYVMGYYDSDSYGYSPDSSPRTFTCVRSIHTIRNKEAEEQQAKEEMQRAKEAEIARELKEAEVTKQQAKIDKLNQSQETLIWFSDWEAKFSPSTEIGRQFNQLLVDMHNADSLMRDNLSVASAMLRSRDINAINASRTYSAVGAAQRQNLNNLTKEFIDLWGKQGIDFKRRFKNSSDTVMVTMLVPNFKESEPRPGFPMSKINPFVRINISQNKLFSIERITAYAPGEGIIVLHGK